MAYRALCTRENILSLNRADNKVLVLNHHMNIYRTFCLIASLKCKIGNLHSFESQVILWRWRNCRRFGCGYATSRSDIRRWKQEFDARRKEDGERFNMMKLLSEVVEELRILWCSFFIIDLRPISFLIYRVVLKTGDEKCFFASKQRLTRHRMKDVDKNRHMTECLKCRVFNA